MYYPCHQRVTRPDVRDFQQVLQRWLEARTPFSTKDAEKAAFDALFRRFVALGFTQSDFSRLGHALTVEMQGLLTWGEWFAAGRQILDVSPVLTEALHYSDAGDLVIQDLLPGAQDLFGRAVFVHFSEGHDIRFSDEKVRFEGAYVLMDPRALRIVLCGRLPMTTLADERWRERYDLRIPGELYGLPIADAVEQALQIDMEDIDRAAAQTPEKGQPAIESLRKHRLDNHAAWKEAVFLIMNLMAWAKQSSEDVHEYWPPDAPDRLVRQSADPSVKAARRARSKLWDMGHLVARRVGDRFAEQFSLDRTRKAHWRRGHWRNQAHGVAFSLRKLIWIWPTMVSSSES